MSPRDLRLNLKRPKVFYGWWVVGACFIFALYVGGVIFYGFTAIFEPIANEFGWSYTQISIAASLRGMEIGLLAPIMGLLVERLGPRRLMFTGAALTGLSLILLSRITSIGMFYGVFALMAVGIGTSSSTVMMTAVANWFRRRIGIATGIMISGWGLSGLLVPVVTRLIDIYDWRTAVAILGLGMLVIGLPISLLVRHKPEQYGYLPDGDTSSTVSLDKGRTSAQVTDMDTGTKEALTNRAFWHMALAAMSQQTIMAAVITHVMPYLSSIRVARSTSSLVASAIPLMSVIGRLGFGWLGDRFDKRYVTAGGFALITLGMLFFGYAADGEIWLVVPFIILFGVGYGGNNTMRASLLMEYFGRRKFGILIGFTMGIGALGNVVGAPLAGWVFDNWGSYQPIWFALVGLAAVALVIIATTPPVSATHPPIPQKD